MTFMLVPKRVPPKRTPYVADAADEFVRFKSTLKSSSVPSYRSLLIGSGGRQGGRRPQGPALARSIYGNRRIGEMQLVDWAEWWAARCPERMAQNTLRRNTIQYRQFLTYCVSAGWISPECLDFMSGRLLAGEPAREWLEPAQLAEHLRVFRLLCTRHPHAYDDMREFIVEFALKTGVRPAEIVAAKAKDLEPNRRTGAGVLTVIGKGSGGGKKRTVPVSKGFVLRWKEHRLKHELGSTDHMVYRRNWKFEGADDTVGHWVVVDKAQPASTGALREFTSRLQTDMEALVATGGMDMDLLPGWKLTPKVWRKTYACNQYIAWVRGLGGQSMKQLQRSLGHSESRTTEMYLPLIEEYLDRESEPIGSIEAARRIADNEDDGLAGAAVPA